MDHNAEAKRYIATIVAQLESDGFSMRQISYLINKYKTEPPIEAVMIMCETDKLMDEWPRDKAYDSELCCLARIINIQLANRDG